MSRLRVWASNGFRAAVLAALIAHFALTGVYVLYTNPLGRTLQPVLNAYTDAYFAQDWALFAPNPLSANFSLRVRPLTAAESAAVEHAGLPKTGWYDLTRPIWEHRQRMPFSYDQSLAHFHFTMIQQYLAGDPAQFSGIYACQEESEAACEAAKAGRTWARERATLYLWRLGSEFVNARFAAGTYAAVALKIHAEYPRSWRDRGSVGPRPTRDILLGVFAIDPTRSPMPGPVAAVVP